MIVLKNNEFEANGMNGWWDKNIKSLRRDLSIRNIAKVAPIAIKAAKLLPDGNIKRVTTFLQESRVGQAVKFLENSEANKFIKGISKTKTGRIITKFGKDKLTQQGVTFPSDKQVRTLADAKGTTPEAILAGIADDVEVKHSIPKFANTIMPNPAQEATIEEINNFKNAVSVDVKKDNTLMYVGLAGLVGVGIYYATK